MDMINEINQIRKDIFEDRKEDVVMRVLQLAERVQTMIAGEDRLRFNQALEYINAAIVNKDYLLLSDVISFEVKPLIMKQVN